MATPDFNFPLTTFKFSEDLSLYHSNLNYAVRNGSDVVFSNSSASHAVLVLSEMFSHAKQSIIIFGDTLREQLSSVNLYANTLREAIDRGVNVRVLLTNRNRELSPMANWLRELTCDNVNIRISENAEEMLNRALSKDNTTNPINYHFTVVDGKMFRIEYDINSFKATACYKYIPIASGLETAFNIVFNSIRQ